MGCEECIALLQLLTWEGRDHQQVQKWIGELLQGKKWSVSPHHRRGHTGQPELGAAHTLTVVVEGRPPPDGLPLRGSQ